MIRNYQSQLTYYQSQSQRSPKWLRDDDDPLMITADDRLFVACALTVERPIDIRQIGGWIDVLVDGLADHSAVRCVCVTTTAIRLHLIVVDDGGSGQKGFIQVQINTVIKGFVIEEGLVAATATAIEILLNRELLLNELRQILRFDILDVQDRLIVRDEFGLDQCLVR